MNQSRTSRFNNIKPDLCPSVCKDARSSRGAGKLALEDQNRRLLVVKWKKKKLILVQTYFQLGACKSTSKDKTETNPVLEADKTRTLKKRAPISHEAQTNNNKRTVSVHFEWK